jgi:hypothetical protein
MPRIRRAISALQRPADRGAVPAGRRRRSHRHLGRGGLRGHRRVRPDARQAHRHAPTRGGRDALAARCRRRAPRRRDQPATTCGILVDAAFARRRAHHALPGRDCLQQHRRSAQAAGTQTTVQDWPGRIGYWDVGVPPSGPMDDDRALRLANRLLGNPEGAAALEITDRRRLCASTVDAVIAIAGAAIPPQSMARRVHLAPRRSGPAAHWNSARIAGAGAALLPLRARRLRPAAYLGSRSTFTLGQFGGHGGRALRAGDVLRLVRDAPTWPARTWIRRCARARTRANSA